MTVGCNTYFVVRPEGIFEIRTPFSSASGRELSFIVGHILIA